MFGRQRGRVVMMRQGDGSMRPVRTGPRSCDDVGHGVCPLCRYPRWLESLDEEGREAERVRVEADRERVRAEVAAGAYGGRLGAVVRTVSLEEDEVDVAGRLQDLAFAACEAAAVLAVAEVRGRGVRAAEAVEARTWAALVAAL